MTDRMKNYNRMQNIIGTFLDKYHTLGAKKCSEAKISGGSDPTVRLIGSHISVMKPFIETDTVPSEGIYMVQPCVRTQNIRGIKDTENVPSWASYFPSLGNMFGKGSADQITHDILSFFRDDLNMSDNDIKININSNDVDLMAACKNNDLEHMMVTDTMPEKYYQHILGMEGIKGRNYNIAIRNASTGDFADIGNVIVVETKDKEIGVEVAMGASNISKQVYGLTHVLDNFPVYCSNNENPAIKRRFEDALLATVVLYQDGLKPNTKKGAGRMLRDYVKALNHFQEVEGKSLSGMGWDIHHTSGLMFKNNGELATEIVEQMKRYGAKDNDTNGKRDLPTERSWGYYDRTISQEANQSK